MSVEAWVFRHGFSDIDFPRLLNMQATGYVPAAPTCARQLQQAYPEPVEYCRAVAASTYGYNVCGFDADMVLIVASADMGLGTWKWAQRRQYASPTLRPMHHAICFDTNAIQASRKFAI